MEWELIVGADIGSKRLSVAWAYVSFPPEDVYYIDHIDVGSFETSAQNQADAWSDIVYELEASIYDEMNANKFSKCKAFIEEPPFVRNHRTLMLLSGMYGVVSVSFALEGFLTSGVAVAEWKKVAVGKGNATKGEVAEAMKEKWDSPNLSQDEYDSLGVLSYGIEINRLTRKVSNGLSVQ